MTERYTAIEGVEHAEHAHTHAHESAHPVVRNAPLLAAVLAVLAGLASLYSSRLGEAMLSAKNEAVLAQTRASDAWAEYQADSLKAHFAETMALVTGNAAVQRRLSGDAHQYRKRQPPLRAEALAGQTERDAALRDADRIERRKLVFDSSVALLEIAVVLASVSAMTNRPLLAYVAAVGGVAALVVAARGFF